MNLPIWTVYLFFENNFQDKKKIRKVEELILIINNLNHKNCFFSILKIIFKAFFEALS